MTSPNTSCNLHTPRPAALATPRPSQLYPSCSSQAFIANCCSQRGSSNCGCVGTLCQFRRVTQSPLVWEATFFKQRCVC